MPTLFTIIVVAVLLYIFQSTFAWKGESMNVQQLKEAWGTSAHRPVGAHLLDVREPDEFAAGRVPGAVNIPLDQVASRASDLQHFNTIYCICRSGARSSMACKVLEKQLPPSVKLVNIIGGTSAWDSAGYPIEK